jgi:predicted GTPase
LADQGFLLDPDSEYAKCHQSDVRSFESISDIHCLVLMGEPGIGKSTTLQAEFEKARQATEVTGDFAVLF